ncbi:MAG: hypothetical protein K2X64_00770 [Rhodocyclaceae bacterium]|jgi:hypothetical protein|nr:hypothetical protein [Rhodocyclaceae bacterium]
MKTLSTLALSLILTLNIFGSAVHAKDYSEYTIHQLETLTFPQWWSLFKRYAKERGERISETDRQYYKQEYFDKGLFPDEAFESEFE